MSIVFRIEEVDLIGSTNEACRQRAEKGEPAGLVIRADRQSAGRGRRGRTWTSPVGNLYASLLLRPERSAADAAALGFAAVTAIGDVAEDLLPPPFVVGHKWPNDLLINGKKAAGLLLEAQGDGKGGLSWLVLGLGLNLASHPLDTPYPATDLVSEGAASSSPRLVLERFLAVFAPLYDRWLANGFSAVAPAWRQRAVGLGEMVEVRLDRETVAGRFADLDEDGALILDQGAGGTRRITAGDVYFPAMAKG